MPTAPTHVTPYSGIPPSSTDPANFDARADAKVAEDATKVDEFNSLADNCYANALEAYNSAVTAGTQKAGAESAAAAAAASATASASSAGASAWVSGTTYAIGDKRWSLLNGRVYVRLTAGAGTTDPQNDATNWADVIGGRRIRITSNTNAQVGCLYELDSSGGSFTVTLPATFNAQDRIGFVDVGLALGTNNVTVSRNGNNIRRVAEDLILDQTADSFSLVGQTSIGWIEE